MPRGLLWVALAVALLGGACAPERTGDDSVDGPGSPPADGPCKAGATRCDADNFQVCDSGAYMTQKTCNQGLSCDSTLGCVSCQPGRGDTCVGDAVHHCSADGSYGDVVTTCQPGQCHAGRCTDSTMCTTAGVDLIYVVDEDSHLLSFDPRTPMNAYKLIGTLKCPAGEALDGSGEGHPFSMAVDRNARAYVLYSSGEIFLVSTSDASCKPTTFKWGQRGFEQFGMGFVSDAPGSDNETLFIAGGAYDYQDGGNLGTIDVKTLLVTNIAAVHTMGQSLPELTGTGKAELYGYYPGSSPFVAQIEKTTAKNLQSWKMPSILGDPRAWAFAQWGGRFYIFITVELDGGSEPSYVYELDPMTGTAREFLTFTKYKVVGAGVLTCAPVVVG